jgi:hypothetical protein
MANDRKKLEDRATELGLTFVADTSDDDLRQLISDFEDDYSNDYGPDHKFYRSKISGLSVITGAPKKGDVKPQEVRFVPYEGRDAFDNTVKYGYLATANGSAIKKLSVDPNVKEISRRQFEEETSELRQVTY